MNLVEVIREFKTDDDCRKYLERLRWPEGIRCMRCNSSNVRRLSVPDKKLRMREIVECKICQYQFSVTAGTIFHDSHLPLTKWFLAVALMCESKKGMSANQIHKSLKIQYRTAWYLCHRIRKAMEKGDFFTGKLGAGGKIVESDETYVGGRYDRRRKRAPHDKPAVMGIIERHGRIKAHIIPTASKKVLMDNLKEYVAEDVKFIATDELSGYKNLNKLFPHRAVNHSRLQWVHGNVHTNSVENFWSLFKRGLVGSFHQVSVKHLGRYINEFSYRFNNRDDKDLFSSTLGHLVTTDKMTYAELTEKPKETVPF